MKLQFRISAIVTTLTVFGIIFGLAVWLRDSSRIYLNSESVTQHQVISLGTVIRRPYQLVITVNGQLDSMARIISHNGHQVSKIGPGVVSTKITGECYAVPERIEYVPCGVAHGWLVINYRYLSW